VAGLAAAGLTGGVALGIVRLSDGDAATGDPECAVAGPKGDPALFTESFGARQTVIVVGRGEIPGVVSEELDAYLKEQGAVLGRREENGWMSVKAGWERDRRAAGRLKVTGKRLNRRGGRFRAEVSPVYGGKRFARIVPSDLFLSSTGCWRVRARAGKARVTYVVLVRRPRAGELER
jgi:hypothetical protein